MDNLIITPAEIKVYRQSTAQRFKDLAFSSDEEVREIMLKERAKEEKIKAEATASQLTIKDWPILAKGWEHFYKKFDALSCSLESVIIPKRTPKEEQNFQRLIIMVPGISSQKSYEICQSLFPCWKWTGDSLDSVIKENERDPERQGPYAFWVGDHLKALFNRLIGLNYDQIKDKKIKTEILAERLIHEAKYFLENQDKTDVPKHLDITGITLVSGSVYSTGNIPTVDWEEQQDNKKGQGLRICWQQPHQTFDGLRAREVIA